LRPGTERDFWGPRGLHRVGFGHADENRRGGVVPRKRFFVQPAWRQGREAGLFCAAGARRGGQNRRQAAGAPGGMRSPGASPTRFGGGLAWHGAVSSDETSQMGVLVPRKIGVDQLSGSGGLVLQRGGRLAAQVRLPPTPGSSSIAVGGPAEPRRGPP